MENKYMKLKKIQIILENIKLLPTESRPDIAIGVFFD